jgi:hypothetical protein
MTADEAGCPCFGPRADGQNEGTSCEHPTPSQRAPSAEASDLGALKSRPCTGCAFLPTLLRRFPSVARAGHHFSPPCEGGVGGVIPAQPVTGASHALFLSVLSRYSRKARGIGLDLQASCITPPTPPSQGGERGSHATSFQRAQQKHASRNRSFSSVNTHFSSPQRCPPGVDPSHPEL